MRRLTLPLSLLVLVVFSLPVLAQTSKADTEFVSKTLYSATALLYSQGDDGSMRMRCTATSIEKNATGYVFVTAAHCGCEDNTADKTVSPEKAFFFITAMPSYFPG